MSSWIGSKVIGNGWDNMTHIAATDEGGIYAVENTGRLLYYKHEGHMTGERSYSVTGRELMRFAEVPLHFTYGGDGLFYYVRPNGELWVTRDANLDGSSMNEGNRIGSNWGAFTHVFSSGDGVIYAALPSDGKLRMYRDDRRDGVTAAWADPNGRIVGDSWAGLQHAFAGVGDTVYLAGPDGALSGIRHLGRGDQAFRWSAPQPVGPGWQNMRKATSSRDGIVYAIGNDGLLNWYAEPAAHAQRPVYVMGHHCNSEKWLKDALNQGANAIEIDIVVDGGRLKVAHGPVEAVKAMLLSDYLKMANLAIAGRGVGLFLFDLKATVTRGMVSELRSIISQNLRRDLKVFYCINQSNETLFDDVIGRFEPREGINWDAYVSSYGQSYAINYALQWRARRNVRNFIFSAGLDHRLGPVHDSKIYQALTDARVQQLVTKDFGMYCWTYNLASSAVRDINAYKLDAVLGDFFAGEPGNTYYPAVIGQIRNGSVPGVRLATSADAPFRRWSPLKGSTQAVAATTASVQATV